MLSECPLIPGVGFRGMRSNSFSYKFVAAVMVVGLCCRSLWQQLGLSGLLVPSAQQEIWRNELGGSSKGRYFGSGRMIGFPF